MYFNACGVSLRSVRLMAHKNNNNMFYSTENKKINKILTINVSRQAN